MCSLYRIAQPSWLTQLCKLSKIREFETNLHSSRKCHVQVAQVGGLSKTYRRYSTITLDKKDKKKSFEGEEILEEASNCTEAFTEMDVKLINHLERTSLVDFHNEEAFKRLQEAVRFADTLFEVDTDGVEPLTTVLENENLYLREDKAFPTSREDILSNAVITEEDYFVAPPGNIPLEPQSKIFGKRD